MCFREWLAMIFCRASIRHHELKGLIMSVSQDTVDQITAQVTKSKDEIVARVADLEQQVADGQAPDFTALKAAVQGVDDLNADAPAPVEPTV